MPHEQPSTSSDCYQIRVAQYSTSFCVMSRSEYRDVYNGRRAATIVTGILRDVGGLLLRMWSRSLQDSC